MRKVTKRLLVAGFAALVVTACQDSVSVVQPAPPPPPPPPPTVDATVTIQGLRTIPANLPVNPTAAFGDMNIVLNVEEGDNTVTKVDILFDGVATGCQDISASVSPGEGVSLSASASADVVECFWDSNGVIGECVGEQLDPAFNDGVVEVGARITLSDGTTRDASNVQTVTLTNGAAPGAGNYIIVAGMFDRGSTIGTNGRPYQGGPAVLADGTDNNVAFAACPVAFDETVVAEFSLVGGTTLGAADVDVGGGFGVAVADDTSPFVWGADPTDNDGVEDDPTGNGHAVMSTGSIFDENGLNVTTQFAHGTMGGDESLYLDFTGPTIAVGTEIFIDAASILTGEHYSGGDFSLGPQGNIVDAGVGRTTNDDVYNVNDCDNAVCDAAGNTVLVAGAAGVDELGEDDEVDDADTNGIDTYEVEVVAVFDKLENNSNDLGNITGGAGNPAGPFGADFTEATISNLIPDTDPADDPFYVLNDVSVMFDAADPLLASGDPGSQVNDSNCDVLCAPGGPNNETVEANGGALGVTEPALGDGTFTVDITTLADGENTVTLTVPDNAVLNANVATDDFTFILDTTAPDIKPFTSFESDATLASAAATFNLAGQVVDGDGVPNSGTGSTISAFSVGIWIDTNIAGDCGTTVPADIVALTEGAGAGEVDNQLRSVGDTDGGEADFTMNTTEDWSFDSTFLIQNPTPGAGPTPVIYCMITSATDSTVDKNGTANSNTGRSYNRFTITWQ